MPFFSFSLKDDSYQFKSEKIDINSTYYSKSIKLWNDLNLKKSKKYINFVRFEKRKKLLTINKKILFCLPPKFGLGDAVEYSLAIYSIIKSKNFKKIGIAFSADNTCIFKNIFVFDFVYPYIISKKEIDSYDNIFHLTFEIDALKKQKYQRSDISSEICKYFNVPLMDFKKNNLKVLQVRAVNKISIFPISTSPIRTMPIHILNKIVNHYKDRFEIEIFLDNNLYISNILEKNINYNKYIKKLPINKINLIKDIKKIEFGIFVDSGPLHVAKLFNKKGIFIETSVSNKVLLNGYNNIKTVNNYYKSSYCDGPCGLVDIFSYQKKVGCYQTLNLNKKKILSLKAFHLFNRIDLKKNNLFYLLYPVGCIKNIDIKNIIYLIEKELRKLL